jgi:hypothetical protein
MAHPGTTLVIIGIVLAVIVAITLIMSKRESKEMAEVQSTLESKDSAV